ncbi:MAG: M16 family metallopeptidase [Caldilineaceae bacterium]
MAEPNTEAKTVRQTLDNGMLVLVHETHAAPVASFWIFYRVGSRNEHSGLTGISHWVEHMLFKGTKSYPRGEFDKAVSRAGGIFNGMTSQDWTAYFETFPSERMGLALDVESDRMANAIFDTQETEAERTVILSEREGSENSFFWLLSEEVQATSFQQHSYRHPTIGWRRDLETMTRDDLYDHYRTYYTPNNSIAVAVGDFDAARMLAEIEQAFGPVLPGPPVPDVQSQEPAQIAERRIKLTGMDPTGYYMQVFHTPEAASDDFFPLIILDAVLGGAKGIGLFGGGTNNRSNRLYRALVDTDLAVAVGSSYRPSIDPSLFYFYATLAPGCSHQEVEDAIWLQIRRVQEEGVRIEELHKTIKQTRAQFAYSSESVTHQAYWRGFSEIIADAEWLENWLSALESVTVDDVQRVANAYFQPNRQTVGWYAAEGSVVL